MPKTGTTSIQDSLYFGLEDPAFWYVNLGRRNAVLFLESLFGDHPERHWEFRAKRYSRWQMQCMRHLDAWRLRRVLHRVGQQGCTPIISAESLWSAQPPYLERLREFVASAGFQVQIVVYLRPIRPWIESYFQTLVKWRISGCNQFDRLPSTRLYLLSKGLMRLEQVFGRENLVIRPFLRTELVGGCAVLDFCHTVGASFDPRAVIRSNEALSADAMRLLYAYNRFVPGRAQPSFFSRMLLIQRIASVRSEPFRLHADLFGPLAESIASEEMLIRDRYAIDIAESNRDSDQGPCIRAEADLFRYSPALLDWLAQASRSKPIRIREGESAARAVAAQVERIRRRPSWRMCADLIAAKARIERRWLCHGD